jgi:hypothetical protein
MERDEIDEGIAPSHAGGDAVRFGRVLPDDGQALTGSDVVSGNPVVVRFNVKLFGQKFFPAGQAVAATHGHEYRGGDLGRERGGFPRAFVIRIGWSRVLGRKQVYPDTLFAESNLIYRYQRV